MGRRGTDQPDTSSRADLPSLARNAASDFKNSSGPGFGPHLLAQLGSPCPLSSPSISAI